MRCPRRGFEIRAAGGKKGDLRTKHYMPHLQSSFPNGIIVEVPSVWLTKTSKNFLTILKANITWFQEFWSNLYYQRIKTQN
ncbi:hypothetical protein E2C01_059271 [Portunus trituberculatus]|uniref:Uncharacterized protein n=1 Tax=Portunus trituberculatus TaxID=210409 RepID=A0A5B7H232_PORTR|nr:hypothetical protein [Portunus trituberculatus]